MIKRRGYAGEERARKIRSVRRLIWIGAILAAPGTLVIIVKIAGALA